MTVEIGDDSDLVTGRLGFLVAEFKRLPELEISKSHEVYDLTFQFRGSVLFRMRGEKAHGQDYRIYDFEVSNPLLFEGLLFKYIRYFSGQNFTSFHQDLIRYLRTQGELRFIQCTTSPSGIYGEPLMFEIGIRRGSDPKGLIQAVGVLLENNCNHLIIRNVREAFVLNNRPFEVSVEELEAYFRNPASIEGRRWSVLPKARISFSGETGYLSLLGFSGITYADVLSPDDNILLGYNDRYRDEKSVSTGHSDTGAMGIIEPQGELSPKKEQGMLPLDAGACILNPKLRESITATYPSRRCGKLARGRSSASVRPR
ncbi:MAG: hypothetical protein HYS98_06925 [Deltaproteobacteria bacterium]|nr:hypothetical protein [Deltaproteobacteria bacterium]